jgi:hypothetical protein
MLAFAGPHWLHGAALSTHKTLFYPLAGDPDRAHGWSLRRGRALAAADLLARSRDLACLAVSVTKGGPS